MEKEGEVSGVELMLDDLWVNALSDPDEESDQSLELLLGVGKGVSSEDTAWLELGKISVKVVMKLGRVVKEKVLGGTVMTVSIVTRSGADEVLRGSGTALEVVFLASDGVGKLLDGAEACPVLPMVPPDTVVPFLTAVSFPLQGGPGARVLSRGLRMLFPSPVWKAGRGIPGWANQVEASNGSEVEVVVEDGSGGKAAVEKESQPP